MSRFASLYRYWEAGLTLGISSACLLLSREAIKAEIARGPLAALTVVAVLCVTLFEFVLYLFETQHELEMGVEYGIVQRTGRRSWQEFAAVLLIAFCLGALVAFVTQPITYTSTLILFEVGECIGTYFVQQAVLKVYRDYKDNSVEAIFEYYLFKPHFLRLFFRLAGFFSALILALIAMYSRRAILNEFAWFTVVTTFVVSETIIWYWRRQRDANLPTQDGVPVTSVNAQSEDG